jgi:hypothetical protein
VLAVAGGDRSSEEHRSRVLLPVLAAESGSPRVVHREGRRADLERNSGSVTLREIEEGDRACLVIGLGSVVVLPAPLDRGRHRVRGEDRLALDDVKAVHRVVRRQAEALADDQLRRTLSSVACLREHPGLREDVGDAKEVAACWVVDFDCAHDLPF